MTLVVAGRHVHHARELSELAQLALAFVEDGAEWIDWVAGTAAIGIREYADETVLMGAVQEGLHVSPITLLPKLRLLVSPVKLLSLSAADLRALAAAEADEASAAATERAHAVLRAHHLLAQDALAAGTALVAQLGVGDAPLFQALDLDARLSLAALARLPELARHAEHLQHEAGAFALDTARTPQEFCDYFRLYLDRAAQREAQAGATHAGQRLEAAREAVHNLRPALYAALFCPRVDALPAPDEVARALHAWLARGNALGYPRLSRAVQQIVRHAGYHGEQGDAARHLVARYLADASAFLADSHFNRGVLGQDGATCAYAIERAGHRAVLQLGADGVISLGTFHRLGA